MKENYISLQKYKMRCKKHPHNDRIDCGDCKLFFTHNHKIDAEESRLNLLLQSRKEWEKHKLEPDDYYTAIVKTATEFARKETLEELEEKIHNSELDGFEINAVLELIKSLLK